MPTHTLKLSPLAGLGVLPRSCSPIKQPVTRLGAHSYNKTACYQATHIFNPSHTDPCTHIAERTGRGSQLQLPIIRVIQHYLFFYFIKVFVFYFECECTCIYALHVLIVVVLIYVLLFIDALVFVL